MTTNIKSVRDLKNGTKHLMLFILAFFLLFHHEEDVPEIIEVSTIEVLFEDYSEDLGLTLEKREIALEKVRLEKEILERESTYKSNSVYYYLILFALLSGIYFTLNVIEFRLIDNLSARKRE